ncbi:Ig-like domain repeat protein [Bacillus sp. OK048]|uniref:Ig-like domain repeat protein n=1 Tax=Bacillus sp. OK048 TaxID=1882761 RepID=UPI00087F7B52|nr:Ig-like domain repeat protein [Bacillus sp. OK048]SDM85280.1 Ig-like domain (group 3) [Bacillus sp. OK048]
MHTRKKSKGSRILAMVLAILLVTYNIPVGTNLPVYAENGEDTLEITEGVPPITDDLTADDPELEPTPEPEPVNYNVTVESTGTGTGKVEVDGTEYTSSPVPVLEGTEVEVIITPDTNSEIKSVKIGDKDLVEVSNEEKHGYTTKIPAISGDTTIAVEFVTKSYFITFTTNEFGTVDTYTSNGGEVKVTHGDKAKFTAIPEADYHVDSIKIKNAKEEEYVEVDIPEDVKESTQNFSYTIEKVKKNMEVTVTFAINTHEVTTSVISEIDENGEYVEYGTITSVDSEIDHGSQAAITITPDESYRVKEIFVNHISKDLESVNFIDNDDGTYTYTLKDIKDDTPVEVSFEPIPISDEPWGNYMEIIPTTGSLIEKVATDGNEIKNLYIFSKDAKFDLKPVKPFDRLKFDKGWASEYLNINDSIMMKSLSVKIKKPLYSKNEQSIKLPGNLYLVFDKQKPEVEESILLTGNDKVKVGDSLWFSGAVTVSGSINNVEEKIGKNGVRYSTPIDKVYYSEGEYSLENRKEATFDSDTNQFTFQTEDKSYQGIYSIWSVDKAGNESNVKKVNINIDKVAPELDGGKTAVTLAPKNNGFLASVINFLSFGTFFNKEVEVTVMGKDDASGVKGITLKSTDEKNVPERVEGSFEKGKLTAKEKFTLKDGHIGTLTVVVTDYVNNENQVKITNEYSNMVAENGKIMIESINPDTSLRVKYDKETVTHYVDDSGNDIYSDDVTFDLLAGDLQSGVNSVTIKSNDDKIYKNDLYSDKETPEVAYTLTTVDLNNAGISIEEDGSYKVSADVKDNAGNRTVAEKTIYIDTKKPELIPGKEAVTFEPRYDSGIAKAINFLSFGTFFNEKIEITVNVQDDIAGIKDLYINAKPSNGQEVKKLEADITRNGLNANATFTLDVESFKGTFDVVVTDNVNNHDTYPVNEGNSNIKAEGNDELMIEKTAPTADIQIAHGEDVRSYVDKQTGNAFYSNDVTFKVNVQDTESDIVSGIKNAKVQVNLFEKGYHYDHELVPSTSLDSVPSADVEINDDGSYDISVEVSDNAGNLLDIPENKLERTIFIDKKLPEITKFTFKAEGENAVELSGPKNSVELTEYGFFFKKPTQVTVNAEDKTETGKAASGVKSITVYLQDYENGKYYALQPNGSLSEIEKTAIGSIAAISTDSEVTFRVPASFKGQIFAKATDQVANTSEFVTPNGAVIEDAKKHEETSAIKIDPVEKTTFKDNENKDLYNKNVDVKVTVTDTYSGLAEVEWSVVAPYDTTNNQQGIVQVKKDGNLATDTDTAGWNITKTEENLVNEMTKMITVNHDSNAIVVKVKITDRAGNTSEKFIDFSIDKTAPTVEVTYDNNTADAQNPDFFKEDRTATIVITERNFKAKDVVHAITNTDGVIPELVGWTTRANSGDPNKTTHTATVKYSADGDYTFDITYKDNAGNGAAPIAQHKFTLDKTVPVINVAYNNNSAANGNYFKAARTATISITEHNFETSRIQVTGTATDGGRPVAFPNTSGWSTRGDVHTATIQYSADATYRFDIAYTDMAGNVAADYSVDEFIIDQTMPELSITGVADKSANNGDVAPVISYSDTNFNKSAVSISLKGWNKGNVTLAGSSAEAANGQVYTFNNFEKTKENDDLYTLTATLTDFAGNVSTQTIMFSVNRFGSVYTFDETLKAIDGKYIKDEQDVILTETNVDSLKKDTIKVKMTKNGTPHDLVEGTDYTVMETGGEGTWSQYKYVVKKGLFSADGKYTVAIYSEDVAGNINETIDEVKKAEVAFGIDKTAPVIVPIDLENGHQYPVETKTVSVSIKDNLVLKGATIYLNGKIVTHKADGENFTFAIPSSNELQNVKITAVDAAGNELSKEVKELLVSTNPIVRWYNNKPLFAGSIGGIGGLGIAIAALVMFRKQKKNNIETDNEVVGG